MGNDTEACNVSPEDPDVNREKAQEIERQWTGWMVVYGSYSKEYVAFPLFPAPPGTILTATYPPALIARMQQAERRLHARPRHRGEP